MITPMVSHQFIRPVKRRKPKLAECRICLETSEVGTSLFSPCKCTGTAQYVHEECLARWMKMKKRKGGDHEECEVCHSSIDFEEKVRCRCLSGDEIISRIKEKKSEFIMLLIGWSLFMVICLGFSCTVAIHRNLTLDVQLILWAILAFTFVLAIVLGGTLVNKFLVEFG